MTARHPPLHAQGAESFRFRSTDLKVWWALMLALAVAFPVAAVVLPVVGGEPVFVLISAGLMVVEAAIIQSLGRFRRAMGVTLAVDARGLSLPEADVFIPWRAVAEWRHSFRNRWWIFEAFRAEGAESYEPAFTAFNRHVPSSVALLTGSRIGVVTALVDRSANGITLVDAIRRHNPGQGPDDR
ncbi:hypothetical protein [Azospirillum halopraeferens]|uniref:hypothetical protein n=1 Tax=Azospirillum halopraeferens TaxID=34010 RepID=UPI0012EBFCA8|nr:hypothetical protein [Azospirillum halopraeferens]